MSKEEIPAGMEELDRAIRHCSMVNLARNEGSIFYATAGKHECNGGAWALGLKEITPTLKPEVEGKLNVKFLQPQP